MLFDSGLNVSMIKRSALPKGIITKLLGNTKLVRTLAGCLKMQEVITMRDLRLPKFDKNRHINQQKVLVFNNNNVKYDIILGTNFLSKTGIKLNYQVRDEIFGEDWLECFATEILDAKYEKKDVAEVVKGLTHLNAHQKADLF